MKFVAALFLALVGAAAGRLSAPDELAAPDEFLKQIKLHTTAKMHKFKHLDALAKDAGRRLAYDDDAVSANCTTSYSALMTCFYANVAACNTTTDDDDDDDDDADDGDDAYDGTCSSLEGSFDTEICDDLDGVCSQCADEYQDFYTCFLEAFLYAFTGLDCDFDADCSSATTTGLPLFAGTLFIAVTMLFAGKAF